jgi:aminoglycoside phosphotransferase (APT) family kinase protein
VIDELTLVLRPVLGDDVDVANLRPLTGGASRITYAFDAVTGTTRRPLILRTAPTAEGQFASMELEAAVQSAAAQSSAPVPHILTASNSPAALGNPYLICDEIAGETIVRKIQRQLDDAGRARLLTQCAQALAAIHRATTDAAELRERDEFVEWRQRLDDLDDTTATFEWAFRWLEANQPDPGPRTLTHGDFRMGNLIVDGLGPSSSPAGPTLAAVLDWEAVHIGDVHEDLAWFCVRAWRFGAPASMAAGGLGTIEEFLSAYEHAGGAAVDRDALRWWLVLGTLKWGIICRYQAQRHLSGQTRSVELAAIGRRVCETEWDVLDLLEETP